MSWSIFMPGRLPTLTRSCQRYEDARDDAPGPAGAVVSAAIVGEVLVRPGAPELQLAVGLAAGVAGLLEMAQVAERLRQQPRRMAGAPLLAEHVQRDRHR